MSTTRAVPTTCDARLVRDSAGRAGYVDHIVSGPNGAEEISSPVSECAGALLEVWHGMSTPAYGCELHTSGFPMSPLVFRGHRERLARVSA